MISYHLLVLNPGHKEMNMDEFLLPPDNVHKCSWAFKEVSVVFSIRRRGDGGSEKLSFNFPIRERIVAYHWTRKLEGAVLYPVGLP